MSEPAPVTVVVPTIGRSGTLESCLRSIAACDPPPAQVVIVDQSGADDVAAVIDTLADPRFQRVGDTGRGIARATNRGLRAAAYDIVMRTDDDCTVAPDWVGVAWAALRDAPDLLLTGQVRASGDPGQTPSTIEVPTPREYRDEPAFVLYSGNMGVHRHVALDLGGFDERAGLLVAAEDNDFCWRWLRSGRVVRYEPSLVVWHHDWRTPRALARRYRSYARGQGAFYAKHLHQGDRAIRKHLRRDIRRSARSWVAAIKSPRRLRRPDEGRAPLPHLLIGLLEGWREARRLDDHERTT